MSNSMKLSHACGATQDGWVMVERSDRMWCTGEGNGKPLQYSEAGTVWNSRCAPLKAILLLFPVAKGHLPPLVCLSNSNPRSPSWWPLPGLSQSPFCFITVYLTSVSLVSLLSKCDPRLSYYHFWLELLKSFLLGSPSLQSC